MVTRICLHCKEPFLSKHGNAEYCPGTDCSYQAKLERQTNMYEIGDDAKKSIQKNWQLFSKLLGENEKGEFDLMTVIKMGFNADGFYGTFLWGETKKKLFRVYDYYFHVDGSAPNQKIQLWKASKK
jgi:hypothetical protein